MKYIKVPILNDTYSAIVCYGSPAKIRKVLRRFSYPDSKREVLANLDGTRGVCFYRDGCHPVIAMPSKPKTRTEIATLSHEACHAVENIFRYIGQPLGGELFSHSVGAIVRLGLK